MTIPMTIMMALAVTSKGTGGAHAKSVNVTAIRQCAAIEDATKRLGCYDALAVALAPQPARTQPGFKGKWVTKRSVSPIDDSATVVLSLDAESEVRGWPGKVALPTLILRCKEGRAEAYVVTGMPPDVEGGGEDATVTVRFGEDPAGTLQLSKSTDGEALFFPEPVNLMKGMLSYDTMLFRFTPFNSSPVMTRFDLRGLRDAITPLREACHW